MKNLCKRRRKSQSSLLRRKTKSMRRNNMFHSSVTVAREALPFVKNTPKTNVKHVTSVRRSLRR